MAQQVGNLVITGTVDNVCCYHMGGLYYMRMRPGPGRKEFKKSARYKPQREASERMVLSARLSSLIYKQIPKEKKRYKVCCALQKRAALLFKGGVGLSDVIEQLGVYLMEEGLLTKRQAKALAGLVNDPSLAPNQRSRWVRKDADHFSGVRVKTKEGREFRLYHRDELKLLYTFEDRIEAGDETWLSEFLVRRKELSTYRLKHKKRRRKKVVKEVVGVGEVSVKRRIKVERIPVVGMRYLQASEGKQFGKRREHKRHFTTQHRMEDG